MSRLLKLVVQVSLAAVLLLSFGAAGYEVNINDDGDENLGIAVVLEQAKKSTAGHESARRNRSVVTTASTATTHSNQHQASFASPAPLQLLGSPNVPIALRT